MDFTHPPLGLGVLERASRFFNYPAPKSQSQRLQTAYQVLESYHTLSLDEILKPLDDSSFVQQVLPSSLGLPPRTKAEFSKHAAGITEIFREFRMEPQAVFEDEVQNAVVIYAKMIGQLTHGLGIWENECIMMIRFSEDGKTVIEHKEFVDSAKARMLEEKLAPEDFEVDDET